MKIFLNQFYILLILCICISCKKDSLQTITPQIITPPIVDSVIVQKPPIENNYRKIDVGTGSGNLTIDGEKLKLQCNDHVVIAKGSYESITVKNITSADGCTIVITNAGVVELNGDFRKLTLVNVKGVSVSGDGDPKVKYGFQFKNNVYRAIVLEKPNNRVTIQYASFQNIKDYVISYNSDLIYDGSEKSYSRDLKFLNLDCENTSSLINFPGSVENGVVKGLIKNMELAHVNFRNSSSVGVVVWAGNVDGYDVHHNIVDNINTQNNNHNGIFHFMGNGKFHENQITNHQGNALRAWTYSVDSGPKETLIYNNIVVNSRKYSAFEVQSFANYMSNKVTFSNAKIYNNTVGNMNTERSWYGNVVDVYNLQGGTCKVFNNIGFNFPASNPLNKISNQQSSTNPETTDNLYFESAADVSFSDTKKYTINTNSKAKNKGKAVSGLTNDIWNNLRSAVNPSLGAVE